MVREWTRQTARATGVSLLAPVVLLLTAAAVASGGGLGALGQVADGPALPDLGTPAPAAETLADAEIVGADTSEPPASTGGTGPLASTPGDAGGGQGGGQGGAPQRGNDPVDVSPLPPADTPGTPSAAPQPPATAPGDGAPPAANPVDDVIENARGIGESLPGPLGPTTGDILDLLLPPGSR